MIRSSSDSTLFDAIDHLYNELHVIRQQLRFYTDLTIHEQPASITTRAERFSTSMSQLADQVEAAMEYAEALKQYC